MAARDSGMSPRISGSRRQVGLVSPRKSNKGDAPLGTSVILLDDPDLYRPATPILNWQGPKRSLKPPKLQLWLCLAALQVIQMIVVATVPQALRDRHNPNGATTFISIWIPLSALLVVSITFMSTTRHLHQLTMLMESINTPLDMDRVVESLQNGRFSRFEETWKIQVHIIKMFCRLLKYHHGVHPVSGQKLTNVGRSSLGTSYAELPEGSFEDEDDMEELTERNQEFSRSGSFYSIASDPECAPESRCVVVHPAGEPTVTPTAAHPAGHHRHEGRRMTRRRSTLAGDLERRRLLDGDPLGDNQMDWDEVLGPDSDIGKSKGLMLQVLKNVKLGSDLSKIPLPVDILEPRSLLEKLSDLFVHPALLGKIGDVRDPMQRMVALCRWFVSGFHVRPKGPRKPYNPILGETFDCIFGKGTPDETRYIAEQVSHHPPASVFYAIHIASGTSVLASFFPKSKLINPNCGASIGDGRFIVDVPQQNDRYEMSWPSAYCSGLIMSPVRLEIVGDVKISSNSGIAGHLAFEKKGFWGKTNYDELKGSVSYEDSKSPAYVISGIWHSLTTYQRTDTGGMGGVPEVLFNSGEVTPCRPWVGETAFKKPSRVIWIEVTKALRARDAKKAQEAKNELESSERQVRRAREARGEEYLPTLFRIVDDGSGENTGSKATWKYVGPKVESAAAVMERNDSSFLTSSPTVRMDFTFPEATETPVRAEETS